MSEFLAMGGYAKYVWPAFGITAIVLVINLLAARRQLRQTRERLQLRLVRQSGRKVNI
ncbi:MAG: heme exporter protein CcmD [Gammaproteobacteria bacterium]|jgi:heme exporter protein D|nr:heme exporter protein CcmD [Gammaproteobacteria bacterium]